MSKYNDSELYITTFGIGLVGLSNITSSSSDIKITAGVICISSACGFIVDLLNSKYKKIFTNCGLINKDNETPRLREDILISEKAKVYRMKYKAMKHQGA
ncbi:MAG: hypothetical protein AAGU76_12350 [Sedimentibacter sp.]|uniref:hypothetical protein n=1 Tax=Sedimentibacter sp. TaxID=1960295 RepID=UPI003158876F